MRDDERLVGCRCTRAAVEIRRRRDVEAEEGHGGTNEGGIT